MDSDPENLCDVVTEIAAALLESDWRRCKSEEDGKYYYVIRERDHDAEIERARVFDDSLSFARPESEGFWDWYIRAALAEEPPDRLAGVRSRVQDAGVEPDQFDQAMRACAAAESIDELRAVVDPWMSTFIGESQFDALIAFLEAVRIERVRYGHLFLSEAERPEFRNDRGKCGVFRRLGLTASGQIAVSPSH